MRIRESMDAIIESAETHPRGRRERSDWELRDLWDEAQSELEKVRILRRSRLGGVLRGRQLKAERRAKRNEYVECGHRTEQPSSTATGWKSGRTRRASALAVSLGDRVPGGFRAGEPRLRRDRREPAVPRRSQGVGQCSAVPIADLLKLLHSESAGQGGNLVAHFFRRAFAYYGKAAPRTDRNEHHRAKAIRGKRALRWICQHGGKYLCSSAAIPLARNSSGRGERGSSAQGNRRHRVGLMDRRSLVSMPFYSPAGRVMIPRSLGSNARNSRSAARWYYGMGFTFDDKDPNGHELGYDEMRSSMRSAP